jgi:DnaJ-class molecular chaperone
MADEANDAAEPPECQPCRGGGRVTSSLGGTPHEVTCPWCGGSGRFQPGRDAQENAPAEGKPTE